MAGRVLVKSVTAGTIAMPKGGALYSLSFHASVGAATVQIGAQDSIAVINGAAPVVLLFPEDQFTAAGGLGDIVCTNTDHVVAIFKILGSP